MPELSLHNIDQISRDINSQEIVFSHLLEELIDHVCCDVENEMQNGLNFNQAYLMVKKKMGSHRLKEIQEETLYAVDTKYRQMKNTMKISGIAGTIMFGFAALFKIQHWPAAGILMTLGAITLAFIFMPSALGVLWKETHNTKRLFLFISAFLTGMFFIIGTLFKVQHWPIAGFILMLGTVSGIIFIPSLLIYKLNDQINKVKRPVYILGAAGIMLFIAGMLFKIQHWPLASVFMVTGLLILCTVVFPWYSWLSWKDESHICSRFIFMVIGSILLIIPGALLNLSLQRSYQNQYYPNNNEQTAMFKYLFQNNRVIMSRLQDSLNYQKAEQLHTRTRGMLAIISNIQEKMVQESEGEPGKPAVSSAQIYISEAGKEILYNKLSRPFHIYPAKDFLFPGCRTRQDLNASMAEYFGYLTTIIPEKDILKYKKMLDTETYLSAESTGKGEVSLMSGLHSLEIMKNGLLTVESCVLNQIGEK